MSGPVWVLISSLISFTFIFCSLGVFFMTAYERICSTNKEKLRFYLLMALVPLTMLGITTPSLFRAYFSISYGSEWIVVTSIGALAVFAFALGIGCVGCLQMYRERSSLSRDKLILYQFIYLCIGVVIPLLSIASGIFSLIDLHATVPH